MSYYSRGRNNDEAVDDFDDYDPTPYGGGYDIALTYGRPLRPSEEICYPVSSTSSSGIDYERPHYSDNSEPCAYGEEALNTEYSSYSRPTHGFGRPTPQPQANYGFQPQAEQQRYGGGSGYGKPNYGEESGAGYKKPSYGEPEVEEYGRPKPSYGRPSYGEPQVEEYEKPKPSYGRPSYGEPQVEEYENRDSHPQASFQTNRVTMASRRGANDGVLTRVSNTVSQSSVYQKGKEIAADAAVVGKKTFKGTGKAFWYMGTTILVLLVPLIIVMDREQQLLEAEAQNAQLLGTAK